MADSARPLLEVVHNDCDDDDREGSEPSGSDEDSEEEKEENEENNRRSGRSRRRSRRSSRSRSSSRERVMRLDPNLEYRVVEPETPFSCRSCSFLRSSRPSPCPTGCISGSGDRGNQKPLVTPMQIMSAITAASLIAVAVMVSQWPHSSQPEQNRCQTLILSQTLALIVM